MLFVELNWTCNDLYRTFVPLNNDIQLQMIFKLRIAHFHLYKIQCNLSTVATMKTAQKFFLAETIA